ncbi:unnamed protein product [Prorocentrum cordatum]|uniref:Uncharacterized protein n=1 Tax=Prorocentrum cordatum TaxID=2364126 RepID=A0ABN9VPT8_9DINO|nr:unnamed protein product [Polarella glacialis]
MPASTENDAMISEANGEEEEYNWMELQGNVYSAGIASVIMQIDAKNKGGGDDKVKGAVRIIIAAAVVLLAIGLQVFLVIKVKSLVCAKSVHAIREIYSEYEEHMYSQTDLTVNGKHRGKGPEFFLPDNFDSLDDEIKEDVCQFPLTQPDFLFSILFMWTATIFNEVRKCFNWARRFIMITGTDYSATHVQVTHDSEKYGLDEGTTGLTGLSKLMKTIIGVLFFVQAITALFLLWVGCRWLTATPCFSDLILNGLALTFIVEIKDMLYEHLLPRLFQEETEVIRVRRESLSMHWGTLLVPVLWTVASALWVSLYMACLQQVLPNYRWDIKGPCSNFLMEMTRV